MSTKTTIKRIALVAASALGLGLLSVVPASAAVTKPTAVSLAATTPSTQSNYAAKSSTFSLTGQAAAAAADAFTVVATLTGPSGSSAVPTMSLTGNAIAAGDFVAALATTTSTHDSITYTAAKAVTAMSATVAGTVSFTPDLAGQYTLTVTANTSVSASIVVNVTAADGLVTPTVGVTLGAASTTATATGVVGGQVAFTVDPSAGTLYLTVDSGTIVSVVAATARNTISNTNGSNLAGGATITTGAKPAIADYVTVTLSSSVAGTQVAKLTSIDGTTGVATTAATLTVTWSSTSAAGISKDNSLLYLSSGSCPAALGTNTTHAQDVATAGNDTSAVSSVYKTTSIHACISTRDGNNNAIAVTTASSVYVSTGYSVSASAAATQDKTLTNSNGISGAATVTAVLIDNAGNAITLTAPIVYYSTLATLKIANKNYASQYAGAATFGAATSGEGYLKIYGYDAAGNQIDLQANGNSTGTFTVDSDANATAVADRSSDTAGATVATAYTAGNTATLGYEKLAVSCAVSTQEEKLTITAWGKDSLGNWVKSNSVDYYCSDNAVAKGVITVTPSSTSVDAGGSFTANFKYVDSKGYPVPDYTAVSMAVSNGAGINTPSTTTLNGAFYYPANVVAGNNGPISVLAVGTLNTTGNALVTITNGQSDSISSATDAANEATDAANAATDAANAAAEAADAATAAAQDAQAAVAALASQVADLISGIKAQITALTNLVVKIQKKVKA